MPFLWTGLTPCLDHQDIKGPTDCEESEIDGLARVVWVERRLVKHHVLALILHFKVGLIRLGRAPRLGPFPGPFLVLVQKLECH